MSKRLIPIDGVAQRLGVSVSTVRRRMAELKAKGLCEVRLGSRCVRYDEESVDRVISHYVKNNGIGRSISSGNRLRSGVYAACS